MQEDIFLDESHFLSSGGVRLVYVHPEDETKVIKIIKPTSGLYKLTKSERNRRNDNLLDYHYFRMIRGRVLDFSHITRSLSLVHTNKGKGLVADRVTNYDGSKVLNMREAVNEGVLSDEKELELLNDLGAYLAANRILFADAKLHNILLKKLSEDEHILVIVDGLGMRKKDLKAWFHLYLRPVNAIRISKQFKKLIAEYQQMKSGQ